MKEGPAAATPKGRGKLRDQPRRTGTEPTPRRGTFVDHPPAEPVSATGRPGVCNRRT
ncbi:hypothetical protein SBD_4071 [Streptomyces bottropensis ATCC 25435]|uniref:Uncharacterized protein n=1 Tax=Streptomyces bottropensis ATCC 25435 TaxID=1054862 RepID=M3EYS8_9ACTN|nr:hypothetical protein SBD_4071 [Streptomyces bottropensis ATCC 25435]